mgnify:CR=1 FL=1
MDFYPKQPVFIAAYSMAGHLVKKNEQVTAFGKSKIVSKSEIRDLTGCLSYKTLQTGPWNRVLLIKKSTATELKFYENCLVILSSINGLW